MALETAGAPVGSMAPDFILAGSDGQISLSDYFGKQHVVLYFMHACSCSFCQKHVAQLTNDETKPDITRSEEQKLLSGKEELIPGGELWA